MSDAEWVLVNVYGALVLDDDVWDSDTLVTQDGAPLRAVAAYLPSEQTLCVTVRPGLSIADDLDCWDKLLRSVEESAGGPEPLWRCERHLTAVAALADIVPAILDFE